MIDLIEYQRKMMERDRQWEEQLNRAKGRRIAELHTFNTSLGFVMYALCDDGTIWSRSPFAQDGNTGWDAVPPIPGSWADIEKQKKTFAEVQSTRQCFPLASGTSGTAWRCIKRDSSYASPQCDECPLRVVYSPGVGDDRPF